MIGYDDVLSTRLHGYTDKIKTLWRCNSTDMVIVSTPCEATKYQAEPGKGSGIPSSVLLSSAFFQVEVQQTQ